MTRRLAMLALSLYPLAFRRRYEEEMRALLDQTPARAMTVLGLLRGAVAAHVRPPEGLAASLDADDRLRAGASAVLVCWATFAAAGLGFYKSTEDVPFAAAGHARALLGAAHEIVQILAVSAAITLLAGALPLIVAALSQARHRRDVRVLVGRAAGAVVAFAILTALLVWFAQSQPAGRSGTIGRAALGGWLVAGIACAAVCVSASRGALFAVSVARRRLVWAWRCGAPLAAMMAVMALCTGVYALVLQLDAPGLAAAADGPLGFTSRMMSLGGQLVVMTGAAALAAITTRRSRGASRGPQADSS